MRLLSSHIPQRLALVPALVLMSITAWNSADAQSPSKSGAAPPPEWLVYVGAYTNAPSKHPESKGMQSKGIYAMRLDTASGKLSAPELVAETPSPSFLVMHPTKRLLYAANETSNFNGTTGGGVSAFSIGARGALTALNTQGSGGRGPAYIAINGAGTQVFVANYGNGSVALLPVAPDGNLQPASSVVQHEGTGANPQRQKGPHAHSINIDPTGKFAVAADLGIDKLLVYKIDAKANTLTPNDPPFAALAPGSGPRHFAFHPNGRVAYAINELLSTMTVFSWQGEKGVLQEVQTLSTLPADFKGESFTAEVQVHPSGRFVYGSNRGHDSIAVFAVDEKSGQLTLSGTTPTGGSWPRNFTVDPSGRFLLAANQRTDSVVVFRIDQKTGALTPTGSTAQIASPAVVKFTRVE